MQSDDRNPENLSERSEPPAASDPEAEKLLRSMEWELGKMRQERVGGGGNRQLFRILSLAVIIGGALLALYILSALLADMPRPAHSGTASPAAADGSP